MYITNLLEQEEIVFLNEGINDHIVRKKNGEQKGKFRNKQFVKLIFENKRSKNKNNREQNKSPGTKILIVLVMDNMRNKSF
jgi:hypothetical protein